MLREVPPFSRATDNDVIIDTAGISDDEPTANAADALDDVFGSVPASPDLIGTDDPQTDAHHPGSARRVLEEPSDVPRLRSTHVTNGYREGIAASKEKYMQEGFDEGYSLGAELGMKAGWCLGAMEGMRHAVVARTGTHSDVAKLEAAAQDVLRMLTEAEVELRMQGFFALQYFGPDGIWLYEVPAAEGGAEEVTFKQVATAHPIIQKWIGKVHDLSRRLGLELR